MATTECSSHSETSPITGEGSASRTLDVRSFMFGALTSLGLTGMMGGATYYAVQPGRVERQYIEESAQLRVEREHLSKQWEQYRGHPSSSSLHQKIEEFNRRARGFNSMLDASHFTYEERGMRRVIPIDPEKPDFDRYPATRTGAAE